MTITQKLRNAFPGVSAIIDGFARGFKAARVHDEQMHDIKTLQSELHIDARMVRIAEHSPLTFYDAYRIVTFLQKDSKAFKRDPDKVTRFIIERACKGYTTDVILAFLKRNDALAMMEAGRYITVKEV